MEHNIIIAGGGTGGGDARAVAAPAAPVWPVAGAELVGAAVQLLMGCWCWAFGGRGRWRRWSKF